MDDFNHKTIFVLDHTQYFGKKYTKNVSINRLLSDCVLQQAFREITHFSWNLWIAKGLSQWCQFQRYIVNFCMHQFYSIVCYFENAIHFQSLWTTSVETAAEYCRIIWDLFPTGKYVNFSIQQFRISTNSNENEQFFF